MRSDILKALDQMERGMGSSSTPESRAQVNAETMAARAERAAEIESRRCAAPEPQQAGKSHTQRLQDGEYGRLD